jgi:hypothetical protein
MLLEGSCHCGSVKFSVVSHHPYPFILCYCSICRKTAGGGGFSINIGAEYSTLSVEGEENINIYRAIIQESESGKAEESPAQRSFCKKCGSFLWVWDPRWPELVHPFASAIDNDLPAPPERTHMMLDYKASWVKVLSESQDKKFQEYPAESIADWHRRLGIEV